MSARGYELADFERPIVAPLLPQQAARGFAAVSKDHDGDPRGFLSIRVHEHAAFVFMSTPPMSKRGTGRTAPLATSPRPGSGGEAVQDVGGAVTVVRPAVTLSATGEPLGSTTVGG